MIDALFGSKTRVKLLHLFLNNSERSFYVREITRLIDEQINSVRRELANMMTVGIITSDSADNKLYYTVNHLYEYYAPLKQIFSDEGTIKQSKILGKTNVEWQDDVVQIPGIRLALAAGTLVRGSASPIDLLLVGNIQAAKVNQVIKNIEKTEKRQLNYSVMSYEDFYYRLSVRDKFVTEVTSACSVLIDTDQILTKNKEE